MIGGRLGRWWFAPAPPERLAALRIAIGGFAVIWVIARLPEVWSVAHLPAAEFAPIGVIRVLGAPLPAAAVVAIAIATVGLLIAFTAGLRFRASAPFAALGLLWTLSYRNSWGMVFHTENLLVLHVIALSIAPAADAWTIRRGEAAHGAPAAGYGWAIKLLAAITAAGYLLAGVAKLRLAGLSWIDGAQLGKQIGIDNLRKELLGGVTSPFARLLAAHPDGLIVLSVGTLALELGAPLALLGGRIARLWAWGAWGFHIGVILAMQVWFPYPLAWIAFLPLVEAEHVVAWPARWWRSRGNTRGPKPVQGRAEV